MIRIIIFSIILVFFIPVQADCAVIKKIDIQGLYSISREEFLDILNIKENIELNSAAIRNGIRLAFRKGIFEDISVEFDSDKSILKINARERDIIDNIYITGNDRIKKKTILGDFYFKEGQSMRYDLIERSVTELKKSLSQRGFPHADIKMFTKKTKNPYRVNLFLTINEGVPEIIKSIVIYGPTEARDLMKLTEGDIYDQTKVSKDLDRIKTYYKNNNYINPSVGPYHFSSDGELGIDVNPGNRIEILFLGNDSVSAKELIKEVPFFDAEDFRDDLVEEVVSRISSLYHTHGYPSVQVAPVISKTENIIKISFFIHEGRQITINNVEFKGITLPATKLKEIMSLREGELYNSDFIDPDVKTLTELYNALGYLDVNISDPEIKIKDNLADIYIVINENARISIESIEIKGSKLVTKDEINKAILLKPGDPYNEVDVSDTRYKIIDLYGNRGFVNTKIDIKQEISDKGVKIIFEISEKPPAFFGSTVISGNSTTNYEVIKREIRFERGSPFSYGLLNKTRQRLYKLGLFNDVDMESIDRDDNIKDTHIKLKEGNAGAVDFGLGYGDYEKQRGFFEISYRNLFGMNRLISFRTELSTLEERFIVNYIEPWFLESDTPFRVIFLKESKTEKNFETKDILYKIERYSASAGFEKKFTDKFKSELFYDFSLVKTYDVMPDVILTKEDTGTLVISSIRPGIAYDSRDNPFDPRKGMLAGISLKAASNYIFSQTDFIKIILNFSAYQEISRTFVLAASLKTGIAEGYGDTTDLPLVERFFLGGRTTVRGYEQDMLGPKGTNNSPIGGNAFFLANFELRTSITKSFGIVTFLDGGNVWARANDMNLSGLKYTTGLGLRYYTPVGPVRLDYGYKLQRETGESSGAIHFSIGHAF
ncbi:MAG: outer membrane protein assembly factor BamA [Nitrospiraceae bacterium]|nr:outer membrane protein assembly factor BamA [Nitrospiraceae bacterium]